LPKFSVSWDSKTIRYFSHTKPDAALTLGIVLPLLPDYLIFPDLLTRFEYPSIPAGCREAASAGHIQAGAWAAAQDSRAVIPWLRL
jgi:hypothetical protein